MTEPEKIFYTYWSAARQKSKNAWIKLLWGLPSGIIFVSFILLNMISGWNKQTSRISPMLMLLLVICLLLIAAFYAILKMHMRWERNESYFNSLKNKYHL